MSSRSVQYTSSPLLASKTPVWRSQFIVACIALGFLGLVGRAAYVQVIDNAFFKRQGVVRFVRTLELPANRGRILDRNGLILASSVPVPSIWASPEDLERDPLKLKALAKLLEIPMAELDRRLQDEDKSFVWLKRQVDESVAKQIAALNIKGVYSRKEYKRIYPEGESAAHIVGFTNVENIGQEGIELTFNKELGGRAGSRRVIKNRLGQVVEDIGEMVPPVDGKDLQLSVDSKVQFFAYQKLRDAVIENKAAAGSVVVLDVESGEVLALANSRNGRPRRWAAPASACPGSCGSGHRGRAGSAHGHPGSDGADRRLLPPGPKVPGPRGPGYRHRLRSSTAFMSSLLFWSW